MTTNTTPAPDPAPAGDKPKGPVTTATLPETMDSVTGYDEIGIEQNLGTSLEVMAGDDKRGIPTQAIKLTRAMIAVHRMHEGDAPAKAWRYALSMRFGDVQQYFTDVPGDDDDTLTPELMSESGKDGS